MTLPENPDRPDRVKVNPTYLDYQGPVPRAPRPLPGQPYYFAGFSIRIAIYFGFWFAFGAFVFGLVVMMVWAAIASIFRIH